MTPAEVLAHLDAGQLWAPDAGASLPGDVAAAYQTALAVRTLRITRGEQARGFKIGFTNRGIWDRYQVFAPIWGTVWDTTLVAPEATVDLRPTCQPRIEPELVFGFRTTPETGCDLAGLFDALDWMAPGFEIVQSHCVGWRFSAAQAIADGGLHARLKVGTHLPLAQVASNAAQLDAQLAATTVALTRDGQVLERGRGAAVLDSPVRALLHFVRELQACPGAPGIMPGDVVTTGTWTDAWPVQAGETWRAEFDALLPPVEIRFA